MTTPEHRTAAELTWGPGELPETLDFSCPLPDGVAAQLNRALAPVFPGGDPAAGSYLALKPFAGSPVGRYRLELAGQSWFVRVSSRWGSPEQEKAIVDFLAAARAGVNPLTAVGAGLNWEGKKLRVDLQPFVAGRHFNGSEDDVAAVARTLGECHRALRNCPAAGAIEKNARARYQRLAEVGVESNPGEV